VRIASPSRDIYLVVLAGAGGLTALAWFDLWRRAGAMAHDAGTGMNMAMPMPQPMPWNVPDLLAAAAMWSIMMTAMMLPSATPMLLFFSGVQRSRRAAPSYPGCAGPPAGGLGAATVFFVAGFIVIWLVWSWLAAGLVALGVGYGLGMLGLSRHSPHRTTGPALARAASLLAPRTSGIPAPRAGTAPAGLSPAARRGPPTLRSPTWR